MPDHSCKILKGKLQCRFFFTTGAEWIMLVNTGVMGWSGIVEIVMIWRDVYQIVAVWLVQVSRNKIIEFKIWRKQSIHVYDCIVGDTKAWNEFPTCQPKSKCG